jgi:hypothetical protein
MSIKREREETPEYSRQDSFSPEVKRVKAETYQLEFGPFISMTLDGVPEEYFLEIAEDAELVESQPRLLTGLMQWSNAFEMDVGGYYGGQLLKDTPIAWINTWLYSRGRYRSPRMSVALKYHFIERKPEKPGSKWEFSFGKNVGRGFHNLIDQNLPRTYDDWAKSAGMGTNRAGQDDVAEALVYNEKCKVSKLLREYPDAPKYCFRWPEVQRGSALYGRTIGDAPLVAVMAVDDKLKEDIYLGKDVDKQLLSAVQWRIMKHHTVRWNWRGRFDDVDGKRVWIPKDLEDSGLLYPSTEILASTSYDPLC